MIRQISFRDPDGFVFSYKGDFYRVVNQNFAKEFAIIHQTNLLQELDIVPHHEVLLSELPTEVQTFLEAYSPILSVYKMDTLPCVSYPWEWTPSMLKDAALLTLTTLEKLLAYKLTLKDASFFNIQFVNGKAVFIDLPSIQKVEKFFPWFAYGQFLQHFIFPIALLKYKRFSSLYFMSAFSEGISASVTSKLLPFKSRFNAYEFLNIHLMSKMKEEGKQQNLALSVEKQIERTQSLISFSKSYLQKLSFSTLEHEKYKWDEYNNKDVANNYKEKKHQIITHFLGQCTQDIQSGLDVGANTGDYSEVLLNYCQQVISVEQDVICCEAIRTRTKKTLEGKSWTVLCNDVFAPSPAIGWMNQERSAIHQRIKSDMVLGLAVAHHLYFKGSFYFDQIAEYFNQLTQKYLIIEFVHPDDEKVKILATGNPTRAYLYTAENFEKEFQKHFTLISAHSASATRTIYLFSKNRR